MKYKIQNPTADALTSDFCLTLLELRGANIKSV